MSNLAEPRRKNKYLVMPKGKPLFEDEQRFGTRMLQKMGWSKGKGLGANEDGQQDFVRLRFKGDRSGFSFDKHRDDHWTEHEKNFNEFLQQLTEEQPAEQLKSTQSDEEMCASATAGFGYNSQKNSEATKRKLKENISGQSLEERSKTSRARVHYHKFTRGKDLTRYSEKDLANIFGKKVEEYNDEKNKLIPHPQSGVQIIETGLSTKDYFEQKMSAIKGASSNPFAAKVTKVGLEKEEVKMLPEDNSDVRKEKKKKRKSELDAAEVSQPQDKLDEEEQQATCAVEKKKKRKKEKQIETKCNEIQQESSTLTSNEQFPMLDEAKNYGIVEEICGETKNTTEKKKKKRKEKQYLEQANESVKDEKSNSEKLLESSVVCNNVEETHMLAQELNDKTKKKKKQNSVTENSESLANESIPFENTIPNQNEIETEQQNAENVKSKSKKKTKKRKAEDIEEGNTVEVATLKQAETKEAKKANKNKLKTPTSQPILQENLFEKFFNAINAAATTTELEAIDKEIMKNVPKAFLEENPAAEALDTAAITENNPTNIVAALSPNETGKLVNNVFTISTFCAEQFQNARLEGFTGSNLMEIAGYDLNENLELKIIEKPEDKERIMYLWECRSDKYNIDAAKVDKYWKYFDDAIQARKSNKKVKRLRVNKFKRHTAFRSM